MKTILSSIFIGVCVILFIACKGKTDKATATTVEPVNDTAKFYPINVFIKEDMDSVIAGNYVIVKTETINKQKKDSGIISIETFKNLAAIFLQNDITEPGIKKWYKENIFRHLNTNSIVFNYSTPNKELPIQGIDVNVNEEDNKLNRVDMRVFLFKNDSSIKENYTWVQGKKFYVAQYAEGKDGKGNSSAIEVAWHKK